MATKRNEIVATQREDEVVLFYTRDRLTFHQIADRLHLNVKTVYEAWKRARKKYAAAAAEEHGAWIGEQLGVLDEIITGLMPRVRSGDAKAAEAMIKALDRQSKLLGLDAPIKASVTVTDEMTARVKALADELAEL
ncbi:hypothetical protein A6A06_09585 [Streptomyces sp. CB02923]|uniref:hypothetical protein n=1 Tax=Streptomyces sp. CB02923 TaxID=1718985 RepID=UPI0009400031|nr:hypothetical protein [Streptomyces sp. CB02923]OKI04936.1 hypothetical protein A6A06_09585 [Streptomyces sp. CB02923]